MAARRGRVAVSITADNSGLHRGLRQSEQDLSVFSKTGEKSLHGLHKAANLALGVTGLGGLAFGIKDIATEAVKAQAEQNKLAVAVKNAGLSWKAHRVEVEKNLDAMSQASGFAKSDLSAALSNMIRTTGGLKNSWKDLSIAMDIARTRHMDLVGAQSLVARAALGNTRALKSLGIEVKPVTTASDQLKAAQQKLADEMRNSSGATKEQIRLAKEHLAGLKDQAKQQDSNASRTRALTVLQQKFGGQSAAYAKSAAGEFERARSSLQIAEEQIGTALLPTVAKASQGVAKLAQGFSKDWPQIEKAVKPVAHDIENVAKGIGHFVGDHPALLKIAATFAGIALSVRTIEKISGVTGVTRLLGLGRSAASTVTGRGGGGVAGALTARGATPENPMWVAVVGGGGVGPGIGPGVPGAAAAERSTLRGRALGTAQSIGRRLAPVAQSFTPVIVAAGAFKIGSDLVKGPRGSDVGVLDRYRADLDALAKTGDKGGMRKLADDLRGAALNVQSLSRGENLKGLADSLDEAAKTGNRRGLQDIAGSLREIKVTGDGGALAGIIRDLETLGKTSKKTGVDVGAVVRDTQAHFRELGQDGHVRMGEVKQAVVDNMGIIKLRLGDDSAAGRKALAANFDQAAAAVRGAMKAGDISTRTGLGLIRQYMTDAFRALGINPKEARSLAEAGITPADLNANVKTGNTVKVGAKHLPGAATGGFIGRPGERGRDTVPIMAARGEAVLNRHQQQPVEAALHSTFGIGLRDLFGQARRPHFMASGGIINPAAAGRLPRVTVTLPGSIGAVANGTVQYVHNAAQGYLDRIGGGSSGVGGGSGAPSGTGTSAGPSQVRAWAAQALRFTHHLTPANLNALVARVMFESGGNPRAINLTDINAQQGHPSKGLGQTIDSTFQAYRDPRLPNNIYDPEANLVAAVNYMYARYGHVVGNTGAGYQYGGFVGGDGGSIDDLAMAASTGGVGQQINQIVGSVHPNGPAAKHVRHRRARRRRTAHHVKELAASAVAVQRARAAYQAAIASGNPGAIRGRAAAFKIAISRRRAAVHAALSGADNNTKASLYRELSTLAGYDHSIAAELKRLNKAQPIVPIGGLGSRTTMRPGVFPTGKADPDAPYNLAENALTLVDEQVRAGDLTDVQGAAQKQGIIAAALRGGYGTLTYEDTLKLRGESRDLTAGGAAGTTGQDVAATIQANTDALNGVRDELKRVNDNATQVRNVEIGTLAKSLADFLSGQIAGPALQGRRLTAGTGQLARYAGVGS